MSLRAGRGAVPAVAIAPLCLLLLSSPARAEDSCATAYEESQVARSEGRLRTARTRLNVCTRSECADFIRTDCARWLGEVEAALPTVVFSAKAHGHETTDVAVTFDGEALVSRLDGRAIAVDPGRHVLEFRGADGSVSMPIVLREGEKNRLLKVELAPPPAEPSATERSTEPHAGTSPWPAVLLGVGGVGVAGFATFGLLGSSRRSELDGSCSPRCSEAEIDEVRSKFLLADVSLAVGVLALAGSGYLFWSASRDTAEQDAAANRFSAGLRVTPGGAAGSARWSF
jgi:hypothetical protein